MEFLPATFIWVQPLQLLSLLLLPLILKAFSVLIWRPHKIKKCLEEQGIRGPPYSLFWGSVKEIKRLKNEARETVMDNSSHDIIPRVLPHCHKWISQYGETFFFWFGTRPRIFISDPEQAKEALSNKFGFYPKKKPHPTISAILGKGLVLTEGQDWVRHRRAVSPAFSIDKIKLMTKKMAACSLSMVDGWQDRINEEKGQPVEMDMSEEFKRLTVDVISHTAFGASYVEGREVFEIQEELMERAVASVSNVFIRGTQYLPTPWNIRTWVLDRKLRNILMNIIKKRMHSNSDNYDILGLMMGLSSQEANKIETGVELSMHEIMDECKTFFFAGHETTSHLLTWTMFLLSTNIEWQEKLREEVLKECGMEIPNADQISQLKLVNMVLLEALRLYGPVTSLLRKTTQEMKLGNLKVPKETDILIASMAIHRNKKYWGEDANEFNPMRFVDGVKKAAKHPNALVAFSIGPRVCIGQTFAMMEARTAMALILQRFSFTISPNYKHMPVDRLTMQPQNGLQILIKNLQG